MAIVPSIVYSGQVDTGDAGYPHGKARNAAAFQDGTGTPLERRWLNDLWGFLQALLAAGGITPSGDPDEVGASQYLDGVRAAARTATLTRSLALRALDLDGVTPTTSQAIGAVSSLARRAVVAKGGTNGTFGFVETPLAETTGVTVTGISDLRKLITGGARILAIGDGTTKNAFSTTGGNSWSAGGSSGLSATPSDGVWNGTEFVISTATGKASHSTNGSAWSTATGGSDISDAITNAPNGGLAALASGHVIAAGSQVDCTVAFARSTNHGATWSLVGSIATSPPEYTVAGTVAGNGGTEIYWVGKANLLDQLDLFVSTDCASWSQRSSIPGFTSPFRPSLFMCQDTGLLVAATDLGSSVQVAASLDRGYTWSNVAHYNIASPLSIAVARGRIFATIGAKLFATDVL